MAGLNIDAININHLKVTRSKSGKYMIWKIRMVK